MGSQVAVAEIAVVPTFRGFRKVVTDEADGAAKTASTGFSRTFSKTGTDTGKTVGTGFKTAFEQSAKGTADKVTKALEADVAKASRALSAARLKEQDSVGKVRVAQAQLNEANKKYTSDSSQVIRAQERLATASRQLETAHEGTEKATDDLKRSQGELARAADRAGDELAEAGNRGVTGFRSNVVGGVKSFAGPLVAAFAALGIGNIVADAFRGAKDFVLGSIDIASDLSESVNAVQVAYGDAADEVLKLGENSAQAFGLSKRDLNGYATQFSSFVTTIAGAGGDVAGTLQTLVGRGTDFASVFNTDVSEALRLFQSGLAGETEPLRKYGIDLSAATVEAYALANGIGDGVGALTEAEKVQARYGSLLEQTAKVQGDFANTSSELANQNRINAAEWDNVQAKIGTAFLPVAKELATILGDDVIPVIADLAEKHGPGLAQAFADVLPQLTSLAQEVLPQLPGLFASVAESLPAIVGAISFMAPLLLSTAEGFNGVTSTVGGFFDLISGNTSPEELNSKMLSLQGPVGDAARAYADAGYNIGSAIGTAAREVGVKVNEITSFIGSLPSRAVSAVGDLSETLVGSGRALMDGFLRGIRSMIDDITSTVSDAIDWVMGFFPNSPAKRGPLSGAGWTRLGKSGEAFWDQWLGGMGGDEPPFPGLPGAPGGGSFPTSGSSAAAVGVQGPSELVIVDADRQLIGRMRVEGAAAAAARGGTLSAEIRARRRADA
ncbi:phage tail protein [Microbacterium maritypicum]